METCMGLLTWSSISSHRRVENGLAWESERVALGSNASAIRSHVTQRCWVLHAIALVLDSQWDGRTIKASASFVTMQLSVFGWFLLLVIGRRTVHWRGILIHSGAPVGMDMTNTRYPIWDGIVLALLCASRLNNSLILLSTSLYPFVYPWTTSRKRTSALQVIRSPPTTSSHLRRSIYSFLSSPWSSPSTNLTGFFLLRSTERSKTSNRW